MRTVLVRFDPSVASASDLADRLLALEAKDPQFQATEDLVLPVRYDGEDLEGVAEVMSISTESLIARHQSASWRVAFMGFAPGFGYLVSEDPVFDVPRRTTPRTQIPAGSVALAGAFSGVYPRPSPGGWQLIGRTDAPLWDLRRDPPALLSPGAAVRFTLAERESIVTVSPEPPVEPDTDFSVEVVETGPQLLMQDLGRFSLAHQGVSASGAADRSALAEANAAVGNPAGEAALELAGGGATLRFHGHAVIAVTGAQVEATVADMPLVQGQPFAVDDGDELRVGFPARGLRVVIGIRGGTAVPEVLGSKSSDTLSGIGPAPLRAGDRIPLHGPSASITPVALAPFPPRELPASGSLTQLRIMLGPRDDWFTPSALRTLLDQEWEVTGNSNRVGIRLAGATALTRKHGDELDSEGVVAGAIQVPTDGQPVIFMTDHPLTGGYPVIGAVAGDDLDTLGQLPPGARVQFVSAETPHGS